MTKPDIEAYKLNKIFTAPVGDLSAEQQELLNEVKATRTTPRDNRFSGAQNQANHCWNRYNEWLVCLKSTKDEEGCKNMRYLALKICPSIWTDKWDEERDEGRYPGIKTD
jgi:cytochrome c oxidase subunit 6b